MPGLRRHQFVHIDGGRRGAHRTVRAASSARRGPMTQDGRVTPNGGAEASQPEPSIGDDRDATGTPHSVHGRDQVDPGRCQHRDTVPRLQSHVDPARRRSPRSGSANSSNAQLVAGRHVDERDAAILPPLEHPGPQPPNIPVCVAILRGLACSGSRRKRGSSPLQGDGGDEAFGDGGDAVSRPRRSRPSRDGWRCRSGAPRCSAAGPRGRRRNRR